MTTARRSFSHFFSALWVLFLSYVISRPQPEASDDIEAAPSSPAVHGPAGEYEMYPFACASHGEDAGPSRRLGASLPAELAGARSGPDPSLGHLSQTSTSLPTDLFMKGSTPEIHGHRRHKSSGAHFLLLGAEAPPQPWLENFRHRDPYTPASNSKRPYFHGARSSQDSTITAGPEDSFSYDGSPCPSLIENSPSPSSPASSPLNTPRRLPADLRVPFPVTAEAEAYPLKSQPPATPPIGDLGKRRGFPGAAIATCAPPSVSRRTAAGSLAARANRVSVFARTRSSSLWSTKSAKQTPGTALSISTDNRDSLYTVSDPFAAEGDSFYTSPFDDVHTAEAPHPDQFDLAIYAERPPPAIKSRLSRHELIDPAQRRSSKLAPRPRTNVYDPTVYDVVRYESMHKRSAPPPSKSVSRSAAVASLRKFAPAAPASAPLPCIAVIAASNASLASLATHSPAAVGVSASHAEANMTYAHGSALGPHGGVVAELLHVRARSTGKQRGRHEPTGWDKLKEVSAAGALMEFADVGYEQSAAARDVLVAMM